MSIVRRSASIPYDQGSAKDIDLEIPLRSSLSIMNPLKANRNSIRKNSMIMTALTPAPSEDIMKPNPIVSNAIISESTMIVPKSVLGRAP